MMKFTVKGLIALFVTSSALFLMPMKSDAQVNMKTLAEVAKSCQKDVPSKKYYQQMLLNGYKWNNRHLEGCIKSRYHYSLILDKFPKLASTGEIVLGYPGSVVVGNLAYQWGYNYDYRVLDCLISQNASSSECGKIRTDIAQGSKYIGNIYNLNDTDRYLVYVCPSCVVAHEEVSGSREIILNAFIQWFLTIDKPQRREVISILGDGNEALQLRISLDNESVEAEREYKEVRARVQQQEQERRKQELLGN